MHVGNTTGCHAGRQEVSRCCTRGESAESRWESTQGIHSSQASVDRERGHPGSVHGRGVFLFRGEVPASPWSWGMVDRTGLHPPPGPQHPGRMCGADGMPLVFTQEDFLVSLLINWRLKTQRNWEIISMFLIKKKTNIYLHQKTWTNECGYDASRWSKIFFSS